jgi:DNA recombination protein RmuC
MLFFLSAIFCLGALGGIIWFSLKKMKESFQSLSYETLERSNRSFLDLAKASLEPIQEMLKTVDLHQRELEKKREGAYSSLSQQITGMIAAEKDLRYETSQLVQALRSPQIRGSWGQVHLRRVVELAGLLNHCDFFEQKNYEADGRMFRPDLIVQLPGERCVAVDAKTPLSAYLDASDEGDDQIRKRKLQDHAASVRKHIRDLSSKEYWKQLTPAPEYVILFLPAEAFFSAALQADPTLIETGADQNIVVATPTTLIAILRAISYSWKQEALTKSTREIARLGQELYDRIEVLTEHWSKVGRSLNQAVESYNQGLASFESRVLVTARKLKEAGSIAKSLPEVEPVAKLAKIP